MKKRKFVSTLLATSLSFGALFTPATVSTASANSATELPSTDVKEKVKQQKKLNKMKEKTIKAKEKFNISWDEKKGIPRYISGKLSNKNVDIKGFLEENKDLFNIEDGAFEIVQSESDELGMTHYRTQLTVDGIPVYGAELNVHTDKDGVVTSINGQVEPKLLKKKWNKSIKLSQKEAIKVAEGELSFSPKEDTYTAEPKSDLYLYKHENKWLPVYIVELQFLDPYIGRELFFIDAKKGEVLKSQNLIKHAEEVEETGNKIGNGKGVLGDSKEINTFYDADKGSYYLVDITKNMFKEDEPNPDLTPDPTLLDGVIRTHDAGDKWATGSIVSDGDNTFDAAAQKAAVDAHYYAGIVYDYFYDKHDRNSYDDKGSDIVSSVHVRDPDQPNVGWNNAAWVGTQMIYGDGDGVTFAPLSGSLDVVSHELAHAITDYSADLVYEAQPGALNESFSDVFGILVEADHEGSVDWLLGEDVYTPGVAGDALRSMANPTLYNQPDHMSNYQNLPITREGDWGGVHINSGIPNKAFYNIATVIDLEKTGKIYYRALTKYLTSQSQFIDARNALLQASEDLYGAGSEEYKAVAKGFADVGIGNVTDSNDHIGAAFELTNGETYSTTISSSTDKDYYRISTETVSDVTVNLTNVPADYDLYLYDSNGQQIGKSEEAETSNETIEYSALQPGTYYIEVIGWNGANSTSTYSINATHWDIDDATDSFETAYELPIDQPYKTTIASASDEDFYRFEAEVPGEIKVNLTDVPTNYDIYLYDQNKQLVGKSEEVGTTDESIVYDALVAGTYYVKVVGKNGVSSTSPYSITATYPTESKWFYEIVDYQTPHPYPNLYNDGFTFNKPGVQKVAVHFAYIETEEDYDFVHVKDKAGNIVASFDGTQEDVWVEVEGDEISVVLESDQSITAYGFIVDKVRYFNDSLLLD
ncbi:M4 family metallopeptidase [Bacillus spongiae]|uniref:M4 family metallopeptidase n=1 Tax=Bacillus spongiae TaxID=2683610 RepID=A0ABU8HIS1_9BACI